MKRRELIIRNQLISIRAGVDALLEFLGDDEEAPDECEHDETFDITVMGSGKRKQCKRCNKILEG